MRSAGQNDVTGTRLSFFGFQNGTCNDPGTGTNNTLFSGAAELLASDVPNGTAGGHWIMATAGFAAANPGFSPDFIIDNGGLAPVARYPCGMVCWGKPTHPNAPAEYVDCVAYGGYLGTTALIPPSISGTPTSLPPGDATMSLTRVADTGNNLNDFMLASPTATNNAGACVGAGCVVATTTTTTTPGATTTTTQGATSTTTTTTTTFPPGTATPLAGTKLALKTNPKNAAKKSLAILLHGANIALGDPVGHGGGSVRVFTTSGDAFDDTYPLPASRWKSIAKGKGFKYVDPSGPIRLVIVKQGKMVKVTGQGGGLMDTLAANPDPVRVLIAAGSEGYCAEFAGGHFAAGKKYIAANAPPPASCP
ncbi:MAG TPA: hypothetical protein VKU61_12970 [Candidatus Binatia bacterium]|nr:hypothetical protein [Candidatus Binatia bacterium]